MLAIVDTEEYEAQTSPNGCEGHQPPARP